MLVSKAFHNTRNTIEFSRVRYKLIEAKILQSLAESEIDFHIEKVLINIKRYSYKEF